METMDASAWPYLFGGLLCAASGWALRTRRRMDGLFRLLGSGPATDTEMQRLPGTLIFAGGAWIFMWLSMVIPFSGGQRPYPVVVLDVALTPLAAFAFLGALLWIVFLRRTAK